MTKWRREFRLVPVALIAIGCLFALKTLGLVFDGGYTLGQRLGRTDTIVVTTVPAPSATVPLRSPSSPLEVAAARPNGARSWMQDMFNYPDVTGSVATSRPAPRDPIIVTGSVAAAAPKPNSAAPAAAGQAPPPDPKAAGTPVPLEAPRTVSLAERAILERLGERRQELDARARELDLRESLLKAAEQKIESKQAAQKETEARGGGGERRDEVEAARFKGVITMYETMKPKEAAKIFDRLDMKVLLEVASKINPRTMAAILAQMSPEAAERLTVELASRSGAERGQNPADLPKIEGKPGGT